MLTCEFISALMPPLSEFDAKKMLYFANRDKRRLDKLCRRFPSDVVDAITALNEHVKMRIVRWLYIHRMNAQGKGHLIDKSIKVDSSATNLSFIIDVFKKLSAQDLSKICKYYELFRKDYARIYLVDSAKIRRSFVERKIGNLCHTKCANRRFDVKRLKDQIAVNQSHRYLTVAKFSYQTLNNYLMHMEISSMFAPYNPKKEIIEKYLGDEMCELFRRINEMIYYHCNKNVCTIFNRCVKYMYKCGYTGLVEMLEAECVDYFRGDDSMYEEFIDRTYMDTVKCTTIAISAELWMKYISRFWLLKRNIRNKLLNTMRGL